jgi:predicted anti-sigma-YlaC factor YlaD
MAVTCEEVRELLPEYADWGPRPAGEVERHLASCQDCAARLASFRSLLTSLEGLREVEIEPEPAFLERTLEAVQAGTGRGRVVSIAELRAARNRLTALVRTPRAGYAVASLTGAAVGATAIALLWWRIARRAMTHGAM